MSHPLVQESSWDKSISLMLLCGIEHVRYFYPFMERLEAQAFLDSKFQMFSFILCRSTRSVGIKHAEQGLSVNEFYRRDGVIAYIHIAVLNVRIIAKGRVLFIANKLFARSAFVMPIGEALPSSADDDDRRRDVVEIVIARCVQIQDVSEDALAPATKMGML